MKTTLKYTYRELNSDQLIGTETNGAETTVTMRTPLLEVFRIPTAEIPTLKNSVPRMVDGWLSLLGKLSKVTA